MCNTFNIMNMIQITKWVLYLIKTVSRHGIYYHLSNLSFRVFVDASDVLNTKEKIGMLKIENYKNKSNMKINKNNGKNK